MAALRSLRTRRDLGIRILCLGIGLTFTLAATATRAAQPVTFYGFDEAGLSPEAAQGLHEIFAGKLFNFGIPVKGAKMVMQSQNNFQKELGFEPNSEAARFFVNGRLPSPATRQEGVDEAFALGNSVFDRDGVPTVNINCFECHAGVVNGQVVAGLGNSHINQSDPRKARTRGDNFGPYEVWRLGARLAEPEKNGMVLAKGRTELQALIDSQELPPVDPMPWWLMKYKEWNYWYGDGGSHNAANFSINFTVPQPDMNARRAEHVQIVAKALAFARETQSPPFPDALDAALVKQGADLFHGRTQPSAAQGFRACKTCHGTYTNKSEQADLTQPGGWTVTYNFSDTLRNVGTDASYNHTLQKLKPIAENINKVAEYFKAQGQPEISPHARVPEGEGYVAPPLVGVWASAPYFHNGSVPTLEAVLNTSERPEIWSRNNRDPFAYNLTQVGMDFHPASREEFDASATAAKGKPFGSPAAVAHTTLYDTKAHGHANTGHPFGDRLTTQERAAVIEFLKSLSGPNM
jgi:mono/diheme cytochrome c family protein